MTATEARPGHPVLQAVSEQGLWFGPQDRRRFGWLVQPESRASSLAVVLCPPLGEEYRCAHRTFRRLAQALAARGMTALVLDYDGTGDSMGAQNDPGRVAAWRASVREAVSLLRAAGAPLVGVAGMRVGALLAAHAAAELAAEPGGAVAAAVLWDPCTTGRAYLREGQALHGLGHHLPEDPGDGTVLTPGFAFDPDTAAELGRLSLAGLPATPWAQDVLVLTREGTVPRAARAALQGEHVRVTRATGQPGLLQVEPNYASVPSTTIAEIVDHLDTVAAGRDAVTLTVAAPTEAVTVERGVAVRERIVSLGPAALFGIVTEPVADASGPWIVLVNTAIELHIGPGRRWVEFARAWAARGFRCLRLDQSGLGNSGRHPGQGEDFLFDPHWLQDLPAAIDAVAVDDAPLAVFGLCSAAYSGFEAAMRRPIDAVYGVGPGVTAPEMSRVAAAYDPDRVVARPLNAPVARITDRYSRLAWATWRIYRQVAVWNAPMAAVYPVLRRGTTIRLIGNRKDTVGYREVVWWTVLRQRAINAGGRLQIAVDDHIDHPMMTQRAQRVVFDDATDWFTARYRDRLPAREVLRGAGMPDAAADGLGGGAVDG